MTTPPNGPRKLAYDLADAAFIMSVSPDTVRKGIHATQPPFIRAKLVGTQLLISRAALVDWMDCPTPRAAIADDRRTWFTACRPADQQLGP
jgi:hypothetical protein